ncbi:MAG TPA: oligosaccharide flippase family protein [Candidatus Omnitrophota bacterium]|nr:oligosaccharide flippase family protein [Candidatus Omnitrophota bacterium]
MTSTVKSEVFRDTAKYISSQYLAQFFGFIISFAMKRFLGPSMIGIWNVVLLIISYSSFAHLGTVEVAYRDIPFYKGAKQLEKAERLKNEAFTFSMIASIVPAICIVLYALCFKDSFKTPNLFLALLYAAVLMICQRAYDYYTTLLRANKAFTIISQVTILAAACNLILTFLLVWPFKLYGLFAASLLNVFLPFWFVSSKARYRISWTLSRDGLVAMLKIGFPLFLLGLCSMTVSSIDKIIIAKYLGVTALGNYSIALMAGSYLLGMPNMFCIALYPRLQEKYGEEQSPEGIKNYLLQPIQVVAVMIGFLVGLSVLTVPCLILNFLPEFASGLPAMKIFVWSVFFFAIGQHAYTFLVTLNKQLKTIPIVLFGIAAIGGVGLFFVRLGWGIEGVAGGVLVGSILYNLALIAYAKSYFASMRDSIRFFIFIIFIFVYFLFLTLSLASFGRDASFLDAFLRSALYLLIALPLFWILQKKTGFLILAFTIIRDKLKSAPCIVAERNTPKNSFN